MKLAKVIDDFQMTTIQLSCVFSCHFNIYQTRKKVTLKSSINLILNLSHCAVYQKNKRNVGCPKVYLKLMVLWTRYESLIFAWLVKIIQMTPRTIEIVHIALSGLSEVEGESLLLKTPHTQDIWLRYDLKASFLQSTFYGSRKY